MSSVALDALPAIVPFFGVLMGSMALGFCVIGRRVRVLQDRISTLEMNRETIPRIVIGESTLATPTPAPPPPILRQPPVYPVQQPGWNYYGAVAAPATAAYPYQQAPYPSAPSI